MDAVDWSGLGVLAALLVGCIGYLSRQMTRLEDRMHRFEDRMNDRFDQVDARFDRVDARIDRLEERYVRHLELHASPHT